MNKTYMFFSLIFLTACASNPSVGLLTPEQRASLVNIEVYENSGPSPNYEIIKQVKGLSCHRNAHQRNQILTQEEALQGVKLQAAKVNADAVINTFCQKNSGTDWTNNCWASIVCVGDAVKLNINEF